MLISEAFKHDDAGFNPYSNGMKIECLYRGRGCRPDQVLILILMEWR